MALPTKSEWADAWNKLSNFEGLGMLLADQAHIFRAFRPTAHSRSTVKVNWSDGAGAGIVGVTAGSPQNAAAAPAKVDDTFTKEFSAFGSQAVVVFGSEMQTVGFEERFSAVAAIRAIYRSWLTALLTTGAGTNNTMWGFETFITDAATAGSDMTDIETDATLILDSIDRAVTKLPATGDNICVCDENGYNAIKKQIRALGGVASSEVKSEAFGADVLTFSGVSFFYTDLMQSKGTSPSIDSQYNFFNLGDEGCQMIVPEGEPFLLQGPKETKGEFDKVTDIALRSQILYTSPRAAFSLIQRTGN